MDREIIKTDKGFKIVKKEESNVSISKNSVRIKRTGKPIVEKHSTGYVYLLIDCSGSMLDGNKMNQAKNGARKFLKDAIFKGYSAGLVKFDNYAKIVMEPQKQANLIENAISNLHSNQYGWTNMADAIKEAEKSLLNRTGYKVIVLVTDGEPTLPKEDPYRMTLNVAKSAKSNGIEIITIGTENADSDFLNKLATKKDLSIIVSSIKLSKGIESAANLLMICDK